MKLIALTVAIVATSWNYMVQVNNDAMLPGTGTVWLEYEDGRSRTLGSVNPGERRLFVLEHEDVDGNVRLVFRRDGMCPSGLVQETYSCRRVVSSDGFRPEPSGVFIWSVRHNIVQPNY